MVHPQLKLSNELVHKASILPKLEQQKQMFTLPTRQDEAKEAISLPKINCFTDDITLQQMQSDSNSKPDSKRRLTVLIPTASGDNVISNREEHGNANNNWTRFTTSTVLRSKTHRRADPPNNHMLLAPTCSSYSNSMSQPKNRPTDNQPSHQVARAEEVPSTSYEGLLAVLPAISSLSASRRLTMLKQTNSMSATSPITTGSTKLIRGSLVTEKMAKRSISLRVRTQHITLHALRGLST